ncbi:MAG: hypothetical protein QM722_23840 [Piscinibacter sp.]
MDVTNGKLLFILLVATLLAAAGALAIAWRYRSAMRRLMSAAAPPSAASTIAPRPPTVSAPPLPLGWRDNRRAGLHIALWLVLLSVLLSVSGAALFLGVAMPDEGLLTPMRLLTLAALNLWPVIPALGLLWRWSRWRVAGALLLWFAASVALVAWRSITPQPLPTLLFYVASEIGVPMLLIGSLCLGGATRAVAPWLLPLLMLLVGASIAGTDTLAWMVEQRPQWLQRLPAELPAELVMATFVLLPWLLAWWPAKWLGRALARAYARHWLSELMVLFTAVWGIVQLLRVLGAWGDMGAAALVLLAPLAWIPLVMAFAARLAQPAGRPPTLLVLRVFQRDAQVQALFDDVVERWRATGNTLLIAGTDLVERTLDAGDIFGFLDGRLAERFVLQPSQLAARIAAFDLAPDAEGRYRINEVYCHDSTWQQALDALVAASDVVLMDLRSFKAHNRGCRHELGVLARAPRLARVVVLTDGDTALAEARGDAAAAPAGRFVWVDGSRIDAGKRRELLRALFVADTAASPLPAA